MSTNDKEYIDDILIYLFYSGKKTSAYNLDRFITVKIRQSTNKIIKLLKDMGLIEIQRINGSISILLTEKGDNEIKDIYNKVVNLFYSILNHEPSLINASINIEFPFLIIESKKVKIILKYISSRNELNLKIYPINNESNIEPPKSLNIESRDINKIIQILHKIIK